VVKGLCFTHERPAARHDRILFAFSVSFLFWLRVSQPHVIGKFALLNSETLHLEEREISDTIMLGLSANGPAKPETKRDG
jgi:hypothetical protein